MLLALIFAAGLAVAADGDSFRVGDDHFRLWGIDAFEARQTCRDEHGRDWACGRAAAQAMAALLAAGSVDCRAVARDRYGRTVAVCAAGPVPDLGAEMVRRGLALDWPRYSSGAYAADEAEAKGRRAGAWRGSFMPPWIWRRTRR